MQLSHKDLRIIKLDQRGSALRGWLNISAETLRETENASARLLTNSESNTKERKMATQNQNQPETKLIASLSGEEVRGILSEHFARQGYISPQIEVTSHLITATDDNGQYRNCQQQACITHTVRAEVK